MLLFGSVSRRKQRWEMLSCHAWRSTKYELYVCLRWTIATLVILSTYGTSAWFTRCHRRRSQIKLVSLNSLAHLWLRLRASHVTRYSDCASLTRPRHTGATGNTGRWRHSFTLCRAPASRQQTLCDVKYALPGRWRAALWRHFRWRNRHGQLARHYSGGGEDG